MAKKKAISHKDDPNFLENITVDDALRILKSLAEEDKQIAGRIEQIGREYLAEIDLEDITSDVYEELDCLCIEDVWNQSGRTRYGYVDPYEKSSEVFEETFEPFIEELEKYRKLSMNAEATTYCKGILKGIYQYEKESSSEFKDWAVDAPRENFRSILTDFLQKQDDPEVNAEMKDFVKRKFPGW